jgi:hypothetical protein
LPEASDWVEWFAELMVARVEGSVEDFARIEQPLGIEGAFDRA